MSDYARMTGQPRTVTLGGEEFRVPKLSPKILGELDAWLKTQVPNPMLQAREDMRAMKDLGDDVLKHIWTTAVDEARDWPPRHDSPVGNRLLYFTFEGQREFVHALLRRTHSDMTRERAGEIVDSLTDEDIARLVEAVSPGEVGDPKGPAATAGTT